ncbi:hypothetical protein VLK31_32630 [Variovorax sp. H27-G14]|uniref:non-homologous end-joining DNA ligase LigD n=1 Tax=Variovorax sp. H27-G14 TaxID=3111914 RepID=UPI0038FCE720
MTRRALSRSLVGRIDTWNSTAKAIDKLDRMIFGLSPGEKTTCEHIQELATVMRTMLNALRLESWLKRTVASVCMSW